MKYRNHLASIALLLAASAAASAQDVNVYSTTLAQAWQQNTPGLDKAKFLPATEILGVEATKLGTDEHFSLHLYGWGTTDLRDQSQPDSKHTGDLTYAYLEYSFDRANADIKVGRFTVNQGVGNEQVDGVSARTDLRGGFTLSAFGGQPVIYNNLGNLPQHDITFERDAIFGARLGYRLPKLGEIGISYLQDGGTTAKDQTIPLPVDYTRRQAGVDLILSPCSFMNVTGRTVFDVAPNPIALPGTEPAKIAEHDYTATAKLFETFSLSGEFIERNFYAYYAGSTLPNLFNMNEKGMFKASSASATWSPITNLQLVMDLRRTSRELYGDSTRCGADVRYHFTEPNVLAGFGYHKVNAFNTVSVDPSVQSYSLSHCEYRAWVMLEHGAFSASLDGIRFQYDDASQNPNLNTRSVESQLVGSLGYQLNKAFKVSGDLSLEDTALVQKQVVGLLRIEYRFGFSGLGGK